MMLYKSYEEIVKSSNHSTTLFHQKRDLAHCQVPGIHGGRGDRIRTCDLIVPNDARYQTVLHPEFTIYFTPLNKKINSYFTIFLIV